MLQQMQSIGFVNKTVLDFGTGTGILAILTKKLGAKKVVAIDNDEWSINNAKENFTANNCRDIILHQKDTLEDLGTFDIILANINLNVITANINALKNISHPSSQFLLSGFLKTDEKLMIERFNSSGFKQITTVEKDNWISMLLTKS
jgi:ribosomal protein L11 methyltransferase